MLKAKNDSERIKQELRDLKQKNKPLLKLILDLYHWVDKEFDKDVILTMIFRTQEEQEGFYGKNTKKKSPHQFNQAVDLRSWIYTKEERDKMVEYLNNKYNDSNYYKCTAKVHEVGKHGLHFHIQYVRK